MMKVKAGVKPGRFHEPGHGCGLQEADKGKERDSPRGSGGITVLPTPRFLDFLPAELYDNKLLSSYATKFVLTCYSNNRELVQYIEI